jgi:hypothetical protein
MDKYQAGESVKRQIEKSFTYHAPKEDQPQRYEIFRAAAKDLANLIVVNTPLSREQSLALTHLEACIYSANAAIARNE